MSTVDRIVQHLDGKREGAGYKCRCPVHDGHHLRVTEKNGKVLMYCFQGAKYHEIADALERDGIWNQ